MAKLFLFPISEKIRDIAIKERQGVSIYLMTFQTYMRPYNCLHAIYHVTYGNDIVNIHRYIFLLHSAEYKIAKIHEIKGRYRGTKLIYYVKPEGLR